MIDQFSRLGVGQQRRYKIGEDHSAKAQQGQHDRAKADPEHIKASVIGDAGADAKHLGIGLIEIETVARAGHCTGPFQKRRPMPVIAGHHG